METVSLFGEAERTRMDEIEAVFDTIKTRLSEIGMQVRRSFLSPEEQEPLKAEATELKARYDAMKEELDYLKIREEIQEFLDTKVRPFARISALVASAAPDELADTLKPVANGLLDLVDKMSEEHDRLTKILAVNAFNKYRALVDAGFDESQAMQILLAGIRPVNVVELINKSGASVKFKK